MCVRINYLAAMELMLRFSPEVLPNPIHYKKTHVFMGSCFADHISAKCSQSLLPVVAQPFGIVFNPISIASHVEQLTAGKIYTSEELVYSQELWHSWHHHTSFSATQPQQVLHAINSSIQRANLALQQPAVCWITLGTAMVYELTQSDFGVVANCHKYPAHTFNKRLLSFNEVVQALGKIVDALPQHQIIFTVSPVRHIRDGLVQNNISKSLLLQAVAEVCAATSAYYFPAYEIVMDQLRDYRFYESDGIHPNAMAIEYVWQQVISACFDEQMRAYISDATTLHTMRSHKVMHPDTKQYERFKEQLAAKENAFKLKYT